MTRLEQKQCIPCKGGTPPLTATEQAPLLAELGGGWAVVEDHHLTCAYKLRNFRTALDFTNDVGQIAELQNHHPDILLAWGRVEVSIWTHKIDGLTESDLIFAAKVEAAFGAGYAGQA